MASFAPDIDNFYGSLVPHQHQIESLADPLEVVGGAWFRHSDAGSCARQIAYKMTDTAETNPADLTSYHSFKVGHLVHEAWQEYLEQVDETAVIEAEFTIPLPDGVVRLNDDNRPLSGCHVDAVTYEDDGLTIVANELKTANEYGYVDAVLNWNGPKWGHMIQASLNAKALALSLDPDDGRDVKARIIYLPMTSVSTGRAAKKSIADTNRHGAQWTLDRHVWEPIADYELSRVGWIRSELVRSAPEDADLGSAVVIPRWYSDKRQEPDEPAKIIADPDRTVWPCGYCPFLTQCVKDGATT